MAHEAGAPEMNDGETALRNQMKKDLLSRNNDGAQREKQLPPPPLIQPFPLLQPGWQPLPRERVQFMSADFCSVVAMDYHGKKGGKRLRFSFEKFQVVTNEMKKGEGNESSSAVTLTTT